MCEYYSALKQDYLYRGDVLNAVPFISLDAGEIKIEAPPPEGGRPSYTTPAFVYESERAPVEGPVSCVAQLERLPGVVLLRTCEANKRNSKLKVPPVILVAPIRPFSAFAPDTVTGRPFHELVLDGFPSEDPDGENGQCYRFMVLPPCEVHGLPDGGMVCFREAQPVPLRHLLACSKIARLSLKTVNILDFRFGFYMQQQDEDNAADDAPEGDDSPIVAAYKKRVEKRAQRAGTATTPSSVQTPE